MNGHVGHGQITREWEEMKAKGRRGAIIWDVGSLADPKNIIPAGPAFLGPFVRAGESELEISVTNLWDNRIVGDLQSDPDKDFTRTNLKSKFTAKSPLLASGLIGPVILQFPVTISTDLQ